MKPSKKVPSSLRLIPAFARWLRAYDAYRQSESKDMCRIIFRYEKACLNLRQSLRRIGYSEDAVTHLLTELEENVNHFTKHKAL